QKGDIDSESRAAAYGGVTSFFEMPNTTPQTTSLEAWQEKTELAGRKSHVNYAFFFGATHANVPLFHCLNRHRIPGIKLFMGASTGNMLVDRRDALEQIFKACADLELPLMTHCEDTALINRNMTEAKRLHGDDPDITFHPFIRSEEACLRSTELAVELAHTYRTQLHVAHVSTGRELDFFGKDARITAEATVSHLYFCADDYTTKGALIKCNPAIKTATDRSALRAALTDGRIYAIGTDHAPHLLSDKQGGAAKATSGMPMVQFSLPAMMELVDQGILPIERIVELMCHHPATLFQVKDRGFLRPGYKADIVVVAPSAPWTVGENIIQSKCAWSPMTGHTFRWRVRNTLCNGHMVYDNGRFDETYRGEEIAFR
ncbi:MAG TPA: amidohydrolase family protein, partial [Prevotella sp.]